MPYKLEEENGGYYVVNEQTGKRKNKTPISKERAVKYMRALYAVESGTMKEQILDAFTEKMEFVSDDQRKAVMAEISSQNVSSKKPKTLAQYHAKRKHDYLKENPEISGREFDEAYPQKDSFGDFIKDIREQAQNGETIPKETLDNIAKVGGRDGERFIKALEHDYPGSWPKGYITPAGEQLQKAGSYKYPKGKKLKEYSRTVGAQVLTAFKRDFDKNTGGGVDRDKLPASDFVDPERRRFPIVKASDVMDAVHSYGRANPKIPFDQFKARVIAIAKRKGFVSALPKDWGVEEKEARPALMVYKDATGADRWVLFSSNAYQDRDREIVSTAALEADVARADKEQNYGPLRWWHVGKPDPIKRSPGPGMDLGTCDFNAMHGRVLIESGTFNNPKVAAAVKEIAPLLQVSIGYFHPRTEPDSAGVFNNIQRFERSILPAGRASNPFTAVSVIQKSDNGGSEMISEKIKAFAALLKDDELVQSILAQAEQKEKEAQDLQTAFKGEEPEAVAEKDAPEVEAVMEAVIEAEPVEDVEYEPTIGDLSPDAFAGLLAEAMDKAMEPHRKELAELQASMKTKDDSEAALRESLELQAKTIQTLKSQLDELTGSQPRAATKGYRDSQSADTVVKEDSRVKGKQPTVDPDFIKMFQPGQ